MIGRVYLDPGDRMSGRYDPPRRCVILARWGPIRDTGPLPGIICAKETRKAGPRNVAVRYLDDGTEAVIPFPRRLRRIF